MSPLRLSAVAMVVASLTLAGTTSSAAPRVVADIAPVHALVAQVMQGVGEPGMVLPMNATPHNYAMRPSEAAMVQNAEVIFWTGEGLTPWLGRALVSLSDARISDLSTSPGLTLLEFREENHGDHGDHGEGKHDAEHAEHADHDGAHGDGHDDEHGAEHKDDHSEKHDHGHDHGDAAFDPHIWLDPANGQVMLAEIAKTLVDVDPENTALYNANAAEASERLAALTLDIEATLAPVRTRSFIVYHDAYQYFETRFGLSLAGSLATSDATGPGAGRVQEIQQQLVDQNIMCIFAEPQFDRKLVDVVREGTSTRFGVLDPLGQGLTPGPALYEQLLGQMAAGFAECLG